MRTSRGEQRVLAPAQVLARRPRAGEEEMPRVRLTRRQVIAFALFIVSVVAFLYFVLPNLAGLGSTVRFTYRITGLKAVAASAGSPLTGLRGIAKQVFQDLGGGEAFIRAEREKFYGDRGGH